MIFFFENLSLLPETRAPKEHFKLVFGSGNSDPAKIRPLKNWPPPFPGSHRLLGTSILTSPPEANALAWRWRRSSRRPHFQSRASGGLVSRMTQAASHRDVLKLYCSPPFLPSSPTPMLIKKLGVSFRPSIFDRLLKATLTNVQAACDVDGAMCCLAPSSF